jgi:hypothetical protein
MEHRRNLYSDIIIFGSTIQEHTCDKCEFLKPELEYLGHVVTAEGIKPNSKKIEAVKSFKIPKTPTQIKPFLGLAGYYRKFIRNFSKLAKPLVELTKKDVPFLFGQRNNTKALRQ